MSAHTPGPTPGPWVVRNPQPGDKLLHIIGPDGVTVDYDDVDPNQQLRDARLIAAAPDLTGNHVRGSNVGDLRAAIAKARGA